MTIAELLDALWRDHAASTPQADDIFRLLAARGELVSTDHVALRSFAAPGLAPGIDALARPFEALGWRPRERHAVACDHLRARYWQHDAPGVPKVLISELAVDELSPVVQAVIRRLLRQLPENFAARGDLPWAGRPWRVSYAEYRALATESPYAAWLAAFGFRVNHFTLDVGALSTFPDLVALDAFLVEHGFALDEAGGVIKGSREAWLEHSATRPDRVAVAFSDVVARIPSSHVALVQRYPLPSGELFHGFAPSTSGSIVGTA